MLVDIRSFSKNLCLISILSFKLCVKLSSWATYMGDECFCLECSKACDQQKWKNPHSCCLLECTAAFPEEPASLKTFCLLFCCLAFSWVATFCLWFSFARLHLCCHSCRCWDLVRGSGSLLALIGEHENSISPVMSDPLKEQVAHC